MNKSDFPKINRVKESIKTLNNMAFPKFDGKEPVEEYIKKVSNIITEEFGFFLSTKQPVERNKSFSTFFRAREFDSFTNIDLITEHSYPPISVTGMGRCNFPKFPVFYSSNDIGTALMEVNGKDGGFGKRYCISKWETISSEELIMFENFLQSPLPEENPFKVFQKTLKDKISDTFEREFKEKLCSDREEGIIEYLRYLDQSFINDNDYSISATLAHKALYDNTNFRTDILIYPSVQTLFKGINFALQPNFVDNNLRLTRLYVLKLEGYDLESGMMNVSLTDYAEVEKNIIMWKKITPDSKKYFENMEKDFGKPISSKLVKLNNLP